MPIRRSQRTYPLSLAANSINTGIVGAYDWAGDPASSYAGGAGADHSGNSRNWSITGTAPSVVSAIGGVVGLNGRDLTVGKTVSGYKYTAAGVAPLGLNVGTGDFTIWIRFRAPSSDPAANAERLIFKLGDASTNLLQLNLYEYAATGKWLIYCYAAATNILSVSHFAGVNAGAVVDFHFRRLSGTLSMFVNGTLIRSVASTTNWSTGGTAGLTSRFEAPTINTDFVLIDTINWARGLSDAEVGAQQADPYSNYAYTAESNTITLQVPAASATVAASGFTVSGLYSGGADPSAIEASFNGSAWQTIQAAPTGGTFSGTFTGATPATGPLTVRWADSTGTTSSASITVTSNTIALTTPDTPATAVIPYRIFQRNGSNQATVRTTGTYTGTPTSIQYRWNGGSWGTLVASPAGGVFDATVTLTGPGQGAFEVRFSNDTAVTASHGFVGVGDVYIVGGQSNHGSPASGYIVPVVPGAYPNFRASMFDKANVWRVNAEAVTGGFSWFSGSSPYPTVYSVSAGGGSYFGNLASRIMETGVPVAFVPCAVGSASVGAWQPGQAANTAMKARATLVGAHRAVLWWQGETDANSGASTATYAAALNTIIDDWFTGYGTPFYLIKINDQGITGAGPVREAIAQVALSNANVVGSADVLGLWTGGVHYTTTEISPIAALVFQSFYPIPGIASAPANTSAAPGAAATFSVTASGTGPFTYQWQRSTDNGVTWANVSGGTGGTTASYTTPATTVSGGSANSGDRYRALVTNAFGTTTSASGILTVATLVASITTEAWRDYSGALLANANIPTVLVVNPSSGAVVVTLTNQPTNASGVMVINSAALTAGVQYLVVAFDATGTNRGAKAFEAA